MLHVPYTASRVLANALALDKTMTKRIWRDMGLPTASFQEFATGDEPVSSHLTFPLFVKPAREGTGMGMDGESIVYDETQLRKRVRWVVETYHQPALVEDYLPGREFTVGVLGRPGATRYSLRPDLYDGDGFHRFPVLGVDNTAQSPRASTATWPSVCIRVIWVSLILSAQRRLTRISRFSCRIWLSAGTRLLGQWMYRASIFAWTRGVFHGCWKSTRCLVYHRGLATCA